MIGQSISVSTSKAGRLTTRTTFGVSVQVDPVNFSALRNYLRGTPVRIGQECRVAIDNTVEKTVNYLRHRAPQGETGMLKAGITGRTTGNYSGVVRSKAPYSVAVDEGTKRHDIYPRKAKALTIPQKGVRGRYTPLYQIHQFGSMTAKTVGKFPSVDKRLYVTPGSRRKSHPNLGIEFDFASHVDHPGAVADPFFRMGAAIAEQVLRGEVSRAIWRALEKGAKHHGGGS